MDEKNAEADVRRAALKRAMAHHGVTPTDLARKCGWKNANLIYNFLNGISKTLAATTYQQMAQNLPGTTMQELMGEKAKGKISDPVLLKTHCQGGVLRDQFTLPVDQMKELPLPVDDSARMAGAFAAIVRRPGAEEIYPDKTILLCVPIGRFTGEIVKGRRMVIQRFVDLKMEVTVREVQEDAEGRLWLSQRSSAPRLSGAVKLPSTISMKAWQSNGERYAVAGVVIGAFVPEG